MNEPRKNWEQVGEQLSGIGLKLKLHFEQAAKDGRPEDEDRIKEALQSLAASIDQTFTSLGNAAKDEAVRDDALEVGRSMRDAMDATFAELGERFRSTMKGSKPDDRQ